ncbi:MAG: hypothetical protein AAB249_04360, partial [Acidobacteriota bacterium]
MDLVARRSGLLLLAGFVAVALGCQGPAGANGASCTITANADGTSTIRCGNDPPVTVTNGTNGSSCTVTDNLDGTHTIQCADGTT